MIKNINHKIQQYFETKNPLTNTLGLARSILALGTLLTLIINPLSIFYHINIAGKPINDVVNADFAMKKYNFFTILGNSNIKIMIAFAIIILILTISGYFIKITALLHWWISISFFFFSSIIDGGDQIAGVLSLLLIPVCLLDPRKNHWHKTVPNEKPLNIIAVFTIWIIRIQVSIIYFHAAFAKINVLQWSNGTAIYYWFNHSAFGMPNYLNYLNYILSNYYVVSLMTYGTIILELLLFLSLFSKLKYRRNIFYFAILFHLAIIFIHGIFSFFFSIAACLILYLLPTNKNLNIKLWLPKKSNYFTA